MSTYFIGDIHGCYKELILLLKKINFCPKKDELWTTGDLVGRGKHSLEVLRYLFSLGKSAKIVLGNHDLNLILAYKNRKYMKHYMDKIFNAPDHSKLISWLRKTPIARINEKKKFILSHAGIYPQWNLPKIKLYSKKIKNMLLGNNFFNILEMIRGNNSTIWQDNNSSIEKIKFIINAFTRMRFCLKDGTLELNSKINPKFIKNKNLIPWFNIKNSNLKNFTIIFGHWSSLNGQGTPKKIIALDTGCCWGGSLSVLKWEEKIIVKQDFLK
ncbi:symmetrical bis(5'-nucleosyl)-tetraphosphatase [Buchnera aphidicola]|uniref:bis(5'-nucleosyl)-tetraphosphatase (symmetrical) n=1 Tax=Buchnera aphidicola (Anoecia oenotherae) TaxID=1241833 RepID=A0A4D6XR70_9GAMM|nr:symmetrical bis(5'-nucleosyl)-tetraphosphatase [Buchnera aphidicola]QCI19246.1 symmetrical bis(5'-nucleosyl)-tetraphosphatase [Buchnera aphidicola (Anoecia oenotherae)]